MAKKKKPRVRLCVECGKYPADPDAKTCLGCDAYKEHQA